MSDNLKISIVVSNNSNNNNRQIILHLNLGLTAKTQWITKQQLLNKTKALCWNNHSNPSTSRTNNPWTSILNSNNSNLVLPSKPSKVSTNRTPCKFKNHRSNSSKSSNCQIWNRITSWDSNHQVTIKIINSSSNSKWIQTQHHRESSLLIMATVASHSSHNNSNNSNSNSSNCSSQCHSNREEWQCNNKIRCNNSNSNKCRKFPSSQRRSQFNRMSTML